MTPEEFNQIKELLDQHQSSPALEMIEQQSAQIDHLKRQLEQQQYQLTETLDLLAHIDTRLKDKQKPPVPISQAWKQLGFKSAEGLRGAIRRKNYTQERGEILRRGTSILVNVQKCLENGYTPIHHRQHSA
ncbi:hypothetical protein Lepto7375DRAFT_7180 [Leptolyngbya sp. PCC 7375]|nr:hypothetical protein Lepto7375DRAFT_7180 [Leptolyngbya sp. PCC 7375]